MNYLDYSHLDKRGYKYISDVHDVMGYRRDMPVVFVGTYYDRKDFAEISEMIRIRNMPREYP